ncbi:hypothetical protein HZA73_06715 [candidate division TA06 bacterium]|nr:hypothetical protein [candidate division TA06 bacterium]
MKKYITIILLSILLIGCAQSNKPSIYIRGLKGDISIYKNGDYIVKYGDSTSVLKNVRTFLWFNEEPYFALDDGRIMRWNVLVADNSYNLQKVWDKLYFIQQHGSGAEWEETSLHIISQDGNINQIMLRKGKEPISTENIGVFNEGYIVEYSYDKFGIADTFGQIISLYAWPKKVTGKSDK